MAAAPTFPTHIAVVLGMHRSGTSAVARALNLMGFGAPATLIKANATNAGGHWESRVLARRNDAFLQTAGLDWSDWGLGDWARVSERVRAEYREDLRGIIASEWRGADAVVIKEPRLCRVFGELREAIGDKARLDVVVPLRNPLEVMRSLNTRNEMSEMAASLLWLRYNLDGELASRGCSRTFLRYEEMLGDPEGVLGGVAEAVEPPLDFSGAKAEILRFLDGGLRHHARSPEDVVHDSRTEGWVADAYAALLVLVSDEANARARAALDCIRAEFDAASPALEALLGHVRDEGASVEAARLGAEQAKALAVKDEARLEALAEKDRVLAETLAEKDRALAETLAETLAAKDSEWKQALAAGTETLAEKAAEIARLELDLDVARIERKEFDALRREKAGLEDQLAEQKEAAAKARIKARSLESDVAELLPRAKAAEKATRQGKRQFDRLRDELRWTKDHIHALQGSTSWRVTRPLRGAKRLLNGAPPAAIAPPMKTARVVAREATPVPSASVKAATPKSVSPKHVAKDTHYLTESGAFDQAFYLAEYPDAQMHPLGAVAHYVETGAAKGYQPNAQFNTAAYLVANPAVKASGENAFAHFLRNQKTHAVQKDAGSLAVYAAISGGYDDLKEPELEDTSASFTVFTDSVEPGPQSLWQVRPFEYHDADPTRTARFIKTHPHLYFADSEWAIWIDGNLTLVAPPETLIPTDPEVSFATWAHPLRTCVYQEAAECEARGKDDGGVIAAHVAWLRAQGFPEGAGLYETSVVVAKMSDPKVAELYKLWWAGIEHGSKRDQLTLPYAVAESGVKVGLLAEPGICMRTDPRFIYARHP